MQPNLPQDAKFRPENRDAILARYLSISDRATSPTTAGIADATHLIWPESPFPFFLARDEEAIGRIAASLGTRTILVTGAARQAPPVAGANRPRFYNSIQLVTSEGLRPEIYDKMHLVPFGEYLPFGGVLDRLGLRQFVHIPGGFDAGSGPPLINIPGLPPVVALICYEAIFPASIPFTPRPKLMLNVTNDGWFGRTSGPYQHLAQARLRSVEQGIPMIRAANTGISAIIDAHGRILASLPLGTEGILDGQLPRALETTVFSRAPWIPLVAWFTVLLAAIWGVAQPRYRRAPLFVAGIK